MGKTWNLKLVDDILFVSDDIHQRKLETGEKI